MSGQSLVFEKVSVAAKANIYFEGRVVSHALILPDGSRKTLGLIFPGTYHFGTDAAERMEMVAGEVRVTLDGSTETNRYAAGDAFEVPGKSGFTIEAVDGIAEYVCSFLDA
jgi:uncharacterized protein YaiE (UPF0345 family)